MAFLPLDKKFHHGFSVPNKQPLDGVEVDWSNPLARGLWGVFIPSTGRVFNLVDGQEAATTSGFSQGVGSGERLYKFDGTVDNRIIPNSGAIASDNITILASAHYNNSTQ